MLSYQYRDSHVKDKMVSPTVLSLTWESPYLGKTIFILRRAPYLQPPPPVSATEEADSFPCTSCCCCLLILYPTGHSYWFRTLSGQTYHVRVSLGAGQTQKWLLIGMDFFSQNQFMITNKIKSVNIFFTNLFWTDNNEQSDLGVICITVNQLNKYKLGFFLYIVISWLQLIGPW